VGGFGGCDGGCLKVMLMGVGWWGGFLVGWWGGFGVECSFLAIFCGVLVIGLVDGDFLGGFGFFFFETDG
jgi:hypothetical protein